MAENKNLPLSVILEEARKDYVNAIQSVTKKYNLPAYLAEPIMAGIYADVRMQKTSSQMITQVSKARLQMAPKRRKTVSNGKHQQLS